jgi:hypothetical protein
LTFGEPPLIKLKVNTQNSHGDATPSRRIHGTTNKNTALEEVIAGKVWQMENHFHTLSLLKSPFSLLIPQRR